jgi:hypothetical protein
VNAPVPYIDFDELEEPAAVQESVIIQNTKEWWDEKCGCISASNMARMMSKIDGVTRDNYKFHLAIERYTGIPAPEGFKSKDMIQGTLLEPEARDRYSFFYEEVREVGFIKHPTIPFYGASPDGVAVNEPGGLELKNRNIVTHVKLGLDKKVPRPAFLQCQTQMSCCGFEWVDYGSYNNTMPEHQKLFVVRVYRDEKELAVIEREVIRFNDEINELAEILKKL